MLQQPDFFAVGSLPGGSLSQVGQIWVLNGDVDYLLVDLLIVGAAAITGFQIQRSTRFGDIGQGQGRSWFKDVDFNFVSSELMDCFSSVVTISSGSSPNIHQLSSGQWGNFRLSRVRGIPEIAFFVQSTLATQVRITGWAYQQKG